MIIWLTKRWWSIIDDKPSPKLGISTIESAAADDTTAAAAASLSAVLNEVDVVVVVVVL